MSFRRAATDAVSVVTGWLGSFAAIVASVLIIVVWAVTGPLFGFSDTWQLIINTSTTIITFNMVFVIQSTQNRDGRAIHTKLDAILDAISNAPGSLKALEEEPEQDIKERQDDVRNGQ